MVGDVLSNLEDLWYVTGSHIRIRSASLRQMLWLSLSVYHADTHKHTIKYGLRHGLHGDVKSRAESLGSLTNHKQLIEHGAHNNAAPFGVEEIYSLEGLLAKQPPTLAVSQCFCPPGNFPTLPVFVSYSLPRVFFPFTVRPFIPSSSCSCCCLGFVSHHFSCTLRCPLWSDFIPQSGFNFIQIATEFISPLLSLQVHPRVAPSLHFLTTDKYHKGEIQFHC